MNNKKSNKGYIIKLTIAICLAVILVSGGTYAYWIWQSSVNKDVVFNTSKTIEEYIVYNEGESHFVGNFQPSATFCENVSNTISFYKTEEAADIPLIATIYMNINSIGESIDESESVYWILTKGDNTITCDDGLETPEIINYGTFYDAEPGVITLESNLEITTTEQFFTVWIWVDENASDLNTLSGETVDVNVWTQIDMLPQGTPSTPTLDKGMIPVTIANDGTVTTISKNDSAWYNYEEKEWANVVLVTDDSRSTYLGTTGTTVSEDDILAYYVWIPRYKYRIPYTKCSEIPEADRNMEDYPECYAPYTMSDTDKDKLASYYDGEEVCSGSDSSLSVALTLVNYALENGRFMRADYYDTSIVAYVNAYNNGEINDCGEPDGTTLNLTPSAFNGNNRLYGAGNEVSIDIEFESVSASVSTGDAVNTYYTHPAFTWDGEAVSGIWVGKFETTPDKSDACYTTSSTGNCNDTTQNPTILPNEASLRYQYIGNKFATSQNFTKKGNVYGLTNDKTDAHMMKNSEWGAVAYLSHSTYGINEEIRINNNSQYTTGCGASSANGSSSSTCEIAYGGATNYPQSTTGNITGVFDMSGGSFENVMGNYNNTANSTYFPTLPDSKYYDVYLKSQFTNDYYYYGIDMTLCTLDTCGGHALLETANWYGVGANFVHSDAPWFLRGSYHRSGYSAGAFSTGFDSGNASEYGSWRSVLVYVGDQPEEYTIYIDDGSGAKEETATWTSSTTATVTYQNFGATVTSVTGADYTYTSEDLYLDSGDVYDTKLTISLTNITSDVYIEIELP